MGSCALTTAVNLRLQFEKQGCNLASAIHISGADHMPMKKDDPQDTPWQKNAAACGGPIRFTR